MEKNTTMHRRPEIRMATSAEIKRQILMLEAKRKNALDEQISIETAQSKGQPAETIPPEAERDARAFAASMLDGAAPASLRDGTLPRTRIAQLRVEIRGIDIALEILRSNELRVRAAEAAEFAIQHMDQWKDLIKRVLLTALTLQQLEQEAAELRRAARGAPLPLAQFFGSGTSIFDARFAASDPLSAPIAEAISLGLISAREIAVTRRRRDG